MLVYNQEAQTFEELFLFGDLGASAQEAAWIKCDMMEDVDFQMQYVYEAMYDVVASINGQINKDYDYIVLESVHGPGTEKYFPWCFSSVFDGSGVRCEFGRIECKGFLEYGGADAADAWNKHAGTFERYNRMLDKCEDNGLMRAFDRIVGMYEKELQDALQDVCNVLNTWEEEERDYFQSFEYFQEYLWQIDDEWYFSADGTMRAIRSASTFYDVDTLEDLIAEEELVLCD